MSRTRCKLSYISVFCLFLAVVIVFGCSQKAESPQKTTAPRSEEDIAKIRERFLSPYFTQISLLAIKYKIKSETAKMIIIDYLEKYDVIIAGFSGNKEDMKAALSNQYGTDFNQKDAAYQDTVKSLSLKYKMPKEKIAALLGDFRVYREATEQKGSN